MISTDLEYPGPWLRAWVDILRLAPGGIEMPLVEVSPLPASHSKVWGRYILDDHVVRLYPDENRTHALCTLLHELAHAFAPYERAKHGPRWRETYARLFRWLTGYDVHLENLTAFTKAEIATLDDRPVRICDTSLAFALDTAFQDRLTELGPRITLETANHSSLPNGRARALCAAIGDRRRCTFTITEEPSCRRSA